MIKSPLHGIKIEKGNYSNIDSLIHDIYLGLWGNTMVIPSYQRPLVDNLDQKRSIIQCILYNYPINTFIFAKHRIVDDNNRTCGFQLNILDGQHRLNAIVDYYNNKFKVFNMLYKDLSNEDKREFLYFNNFSTLTVINPTESQENDIYKLTNYIREGYKNDFITFK